MVLLNSTFNTVVRHALFTSDSHPNNHQLHTSPYCISTIFSPLGNWMEKLSCDAMLTWWSICGRIFFFLLQFHGHQVVLISCANPRNAPTFPALWHHVEQASHWPWCMQNSATERIRDPLWGAAATSRTSGQDNWWIWSQRDSKMGAGCCMAINLHWCWWLSSWAWWLAVPDSHPSLGWWHVSGCAWAWNLCQRLLPNGELKPDHRIPLLPHHLLLPFLLFVLSLFVLSSKV